VDWYEAYADICGERELAYVFCMRCVRPEQFADLMIEQERIEEPRKLPEILNSIDELTTKVWYNRHQIRREMIEDGKIKIVPGRAVRAESSSRLCAHERTDKSARMDGCVTDID